MHLLNEKQFSSSEDEGSEGESTADEPLDDSHVYDEENIVKGNIEQSNAEGDSVVKSDDEAHPYPTPPPDANGNMLVQSDPSKDTNSKSAKMSSQVRKGSILSQSLQAIKTMNNKSGSSVQAIVKFMKASGYEVTDEARLRKLVLRSLKLALSKGEVVQVKRSFKLSMNAKKESTATEKMKAKQIKKLAAAKDKASSKADAKPKANTKKAATSSGDKTNNQIPKPLKKKPSERSTNQPTKKKVNAAAVGGKANMIQEDPAPVVKKESKKKMEKGSSTKTAAVKSNVPRKSIATLAPISAKPKVNAKSRKRHLEGAGNLGGDGSNNLDSQPEETPTPPKKQRIARQAK